MSREQQMSKDLSKKQQIELNRMFQVASIQEYFHQLPSSDIKHQLTSLYYSKKIMRACDVLFNEGVLTLSRQKKRVDQLLEEQVDQQEQKALQLRVKKEFIEKQLHYLNNQISAGNPNLSNSEISADGHGIVLSKEEHKSLVIKINKDRKEKEKKHLEILSQMEDKMREQQQFNKKMAQDKKKSQLEQRRQQIEKNLIKNKEKHEQFLKKQQQSKEKLKQIQGHKFTYLKIQQSYERQVLLPSLQQKKKKLKELRQYRSFNVKQLKQHQKSYIQKRNLDQSRRSSFQQEWTYRPPPGSERLSSILEEERLTKMRAVEDKKAMIQDKIVRQQNYVTYLKENFVPKIDPAKREEMEKRLQKPTVRRSQSLDSRQIGLSYLQEVKKLKKKQNKKIEQSQERHSQPQQNATIMTSGSSKDKKSRILTNYQSIDHKDEHYEKRRRKNLQKLIKNDQLTEPERIKQLQLESLKISEIMKQKEKQLKYKKDTKMKQDALQLLLSSIQAKIGIIEMYN